MERRHFETIGPIATNLAHDFNNVLQVVASANELMDPLAQNDTLVNALHASNQSVQTGSSTIRQLLAYSRNQQLGANLVWVRSADEAQAQFAAGEKFDLLLSDIKTSETV